MSIKKKLLALVVIGVVAVLGAMVSFPLLAGGANTGGAYLDGTWFVMITITGSPPFPAVVTFTPNILASGVRGTYHAQAPAQQFPTPAGLLTMLPSADGVWKRTGHGEYLCHEIRLVTTEDGVVEMTVDVWWVLHKEAEDRVTGTIKVGFLDLDGNLLGTSEGTLEATPLSLEPPEWAR